MKRFLILLAILLTTGSAWGEEKYHKPPDTTFSSLLGSWRGEIVIDFPGADNPNAFIPLSVSTRKLMRMTFFKDSVVILIGKTSHAGQLMTEDSVETVGFTVPLFGFKANFFGVRYNKKNEIAGMFRIPDLNGEGRWQVKRDSL